MAHLAMEIGKQLRRCNNLRTLEGDGQLATINPPSGFKIKIPKQHALAAVRPDDMALGPIVEYLDRGQ